MPKTKARKKASAPAKPGPSDERRSSKQMARLQELLNDEYITALLKMDIAGLCEMATSEARSERWVDVATSAKSILIVAEYLRDFGDE